MAIWRPKPAHYCPQPQAGSDRNHEYRRQRRPMSYESAAPTGQLGYWALSAALRLASRPAIASDVVDVMLADRELGRGLANQC